VQDLGHLELLMLRLPALVGSPLSINALREDLQVSHKAVAAWLGALERVDGIVRLAPFVAPRLRAVTKAQKHYQIDWSLVPDEPQRFENLVACHLLNWVHHQQDVRGNDLELWYFRDKEGREVDFVVTDAGKPVRLVECIWADADVDPGLRYLRDTLEKLPGALRRFVEREAAEGDTSTNDCRSDASRDRGFERPQAASACSSRSISIINRLRSASAARHRAPASVTRGLPPGSASPRARNSAQAAVHSSLVECQRRTRFSRSVSRSQERMGHFSFFPRRKCPAPE
jgi:hypothetical protein